MSSKAPVQKRKADAQQQQTQKKSKGAAGAPVAASAPAPKQGDKNKKPQQQGGQPNKDKKQQKAKQPEPEPEPEEDEEDEEEGERDEEALKAIAAIESENEAMRSQLEKLDEEMSAEIYAVQKKFLLKKRPVLAKRDALMAKAPGLWKALFSNHETLLIQLEEVDIEILDHLTSVEVEEQYSDPSAAKQQIVSVTITFTFSAGSEHVKPGKFKKVFAFDDEKETLVCKATPVASQPFKDAKAFESRESFFGAWFTAEGEDEGILAAQDAISSELYVDPLQLYRHVSEGGSLNMNDEDDDDDDAAQLFGDDDDDDDDSEDDEDAPQLVD